MQIVRLLMIIFSIAVWGAGDISMAQETDYRRESDRAWRETEANSLPEVPCDSLSTQSELNDCAYQRYQAADQRLNETYRDVLFSYDEEFRIRLKAAQLAWIEFRDLNARSMAYHYRKGTIYPQIYYNYLKIMTEQRIAELKSLLEP